ncbi:MAG TPA: IS110 family transposase [Candidatus Dormibacteraeota bacterium]|nr:IS110 family transposase [Candidatus Dormibacteraeota bacterium]
MEKIFPCCAGLDVHKETVEACVRRIERSGHLDQQTRRWATMTRDILTMADWLAAQGVTHVAMESTGVYWKPIFNILESRFQVLLVNARHLKQVPGRKSDIRDCQWIAQLLQHGLLKGSFIPPRTQRELRDLTRHRIQLVEEKTRTSNRIEKILEDCNIKLGSVASEVLGVSGRAMIQALIESSKEPAQIADLARRQLRGKIPQLEKALEGHLTEHHRFMLRLLWKELLQQEALIAELETRIEQVTRPLAADIERLDEVPGLDRHVAEVMLAEVGPAMDPFPTHQNLAAWAGMCPGNEESAGKRRKRRITPGNRWLKRSLVQAAWAASHTKNTYLASQYRRLMGRRGKKRALIAVGHSILVIVYHLLKNGTRYRDLGANFFDRLEPERLTRYYVKRLQKLGHIVKLEPHVAL